MNLSAPFIRRPVMTILVMFSILFFGFATYRSLPVSDLPSVDFPTIQISVNYPGANPATMANAIATPLEQQFMTIEGLQSLFSTSNTGSTSIVLQFDLNRNIDDASTDVQAAITRATPNLPRDLPNNPLYEKVNPAMTPILYLAFSSDGMPIYDLYDYANTYIGQRLSMVEGVSQVETYGSPYAVRVQVDPEKLAAKGIGIDEVTRVLRQANVNLPLGTLYGPRDNFTIDVDGQIFRAPAYNELILKNENGNLVKIKDIGQAIDSVQNDKYFHRFVSQEGDEECIVLAILKQSGANTIRVVQDINATLENLKPQLPGSLNIKRVYDQSESILESVADVKLTLVVAFFLVIFIIYIFFGQARDTIIPSLALPISIFGTFSVIYLFGFSVDIFSMLALTLSIGFLVDDAIVVLENNIRHVQLGEDPMQAALDGAKEISTTVLTMTLCLAASFIPMLFMNGVIGRLFREFAITLVVAVLISGFVSLSLTPMLASRFVKAREGEKKTRMERFADKINERMKQRYAPILHWALNHRLIMLGLGSFCIAASLLLFSILPKDFLPPDDVGFIDSYTLARDGTSPYLMQEYHKKACDRIIQDPNVESMISINSYNNANEGIIFIRLKPYKERSSLNKIIAGLSSTLKNLPGFNCYLSPLPLVNLQVGTTAQALYQYSLTALDRNALYNYAPSLIQKMQQDPHFTQVSSDLRISQPQWQLHIDRERAYNYHVNATDIETYFTYAYSDNKIDLINAEINQYNVLIETLPQFYKDPTVLSKLYVRSSSNALVPLSEILHVEESVGPLTINHVNGQSAVGISFNVPEGETLGSSLRQIQKLTEGQIPPGIQGQVIGTADIFQSSFKSLTYLMILAIFVIYIILGILYESFIHPLTVMSALPPALFGGLFTLFLLGQTLSVYSFVGLILLIGIVLKNGIMLIDFANDAVRKEKKSAYDAIVEASLIRFRPILMTTVAALMGAIPIALGIGGGISQSRMSLGCCIIGGLIISQLLTLLLTPVLYYYFETLQEKVRKKL
jgi:HAE1 family hydrophobic/amphiphilic exporter-1